MRRIDPISREAGGAAACSPPAILLTGFGPFPGVRENATAVLVPRLAKAARELFPAFEVIAEVLPTQWAVAPLRLANLLTRPGMVLALHFGVSHNAKGFQIELVGRNRCKRSPDAAGLMPAGSCVIDAGAPELAATLPAKRILERLAGLGVPARASQDAGAFLCNALLYHSLAAARALDPPRLVGFVHLPADLAGASDKEADPGCRLDMRGAISGGLEIIAACLESLESRAR